MAIENLQENIITDVAIGATGIIKEAIMEFVKRYKIPLLIIAAVIIIWIIYTISKSISNYLMRRRIQRIDMNVQEIMKDVKEIKEKLFKKGKAREKKKK